MVATTARARSAQARKKEPYRLGVLLLLTVAALSAHSQSSREAFGLSDYFRVRRVAELTISSDATQLGYVTEMQSLRDDRVVRTVYVQDIGFGGATAELSQLADAQQIAWVPQTSKLAFLSERTGVAQIFTYDTRSRKTVQVTRSKTAVTRYRWAPYGTSVAYSTVGPGSTPYEQLRETKKGVLLDTHSTGYLELLDRTQSSQVNPGPASLFIQGSDQSVQPVSIPGDVREFSWSSDAQWLSVVFVSSDVPASVLRPYCTSLGLVQIGTNMFSVYGAGRLRTSDSSGVLYWGGEWIPNRAEIVVRRATDPNLWIGDVPFPSLGVVDVTRALNESGTTWTDIELYPRDSKVMPGPASILIETRVRARDTLLSLRDGRITNVELGLQGSNSMLQLSDDLKTAAFVNESLSSPPEIYIRSANNPPRKVSTLNIEIAQRMLPSYDEFHWKSTDGQDVSGWLLKPDDKRFPRPWPLLTYIHGGPGYAFPDQFTPSTSNWPYPFEVLALRGVAVFIPQYRGTLSFGKSVARPQKLDKEPIDDVLSGINSLISNQMANSGALGIAGHSHGGWLGPMIATRGNLFRAGSFAEGWSSQLMLHELQAGEFNREIQELGIGEPSLYEQPERYLELSPDLHFRGLAMAMLLEAGAEGTVMHMLGMSKAARFFQVPSEFVVYPRTGHVPTAPQLRYESAERNLDWFLFWLRDEEDPDRHKAAQYQRWRAMRRDSAILSRTVRREASTPGPSPRL